MKRFFALFLIILNAAFSVFAKADDGFYQRHQWVTERNRINLEKLISQSDRIIGLEVIIAAGAPEPFYSRFGHALLRFVDDNNLWSDDLTLSFVADLNEPELSISKGLFGGYSITAEVKPLNEFWFDYARNEERPLERHIIPATREEIRELIGVLESWRDAPSKAGNYTFTSNNCAGVLTKLFEEAGFTHSVIKPTIPTRVPNWLERSFLSPFPHLQVKTPGPVLKKARTLLGVTERELISGKKWPADAAETLLAQFDEAELKLLFQELTLMPLAVADKILSRVNYRSSGLGYDEVLGFGQIDPALYSLCPSSDNDACLSDLREKEKRIWPEKRLQKKNDRLQFLLRNSTVETEPQDESPYNLIKSGHTDHLGFVRRLVEKSSQTPKK